MAVRSSAPGLSRSPDHDPADETGASGSEASRSSAANRAVTIDLGPMRAVIEDGLLMVFGPDGDPVPPQIFAAAAAEQPHAEVQLTDGPRVAAERIAAVLDAQIGGRLGSASGGDEPWIHAMLGIGPQPEPAPDEQLAAETRDVEVVAFGKELMITSPAGATFLITEARSRSPAGARLRGPGDQHLALGELVGRLLNDGGPGGRTTGTKTSEVAFPNCRMRIEDSALIIDLPGAGAVQFVRGAGAAGQAQAVSLFKPDGDTATNDELLAALSQRPTSPRAAAVRQRAAGSAMGAACVSNPGPMPTADPGPAASPKVPLAINLSDALGPKPEGVALVLIRGLPHGATLSAGVASDDGSWLLSPRDLASLCLVPPPGGTLDLALEVTAITVEDRDGELASASRTMLVSPSTARGESAPIPIELDPQMLSGQEGSFDAIVVRDLPANTMLSAGTYDPRIGSWVLLPRQMRAVTVTPPAGRSEGFTLTLLGISLTGEKTRPRILARIPVTPR
jgi:hypothetical protein